MFDVSIIIISYNTYKLTVDCLRSIYDQTNGISFEVIVVDNNSDDGSADAIEMQFPNISLIKSEKNLGFAKANNLAASIASGKHLLLLNPDTVVLNGAIQKLYKFAISFPENRIYGGRTLYGNMTLNPSSCWRQQSIWSLICYTFGLTSLFRNNVLFDPEAYGGWKRDYVREVSIVSGCFLLIEMVFWNEIQGFDSDFFMYGEDADLCLRAIKNGASPVINPESAIIHYGGASERIRADKMIRLLRAKEALLGHWLPLTREIGLLLYGVAVRIRITAFLFLSKVSVRRFGEQFSCWQEIWHRREEWHRLP